MKQKLRYLNGYILRHEPHHSKAFTSGEAGRNGHEGYVYEHIFMMERELERSLTSDEEVHHLDFDRSNNRPSNLIVLSRSHHARLHKYLTSIGKDEAQLNHKEYTYTEIKRCEVCVIPLSGKASFTCSAPCHNARIRGNRESVMPDKVTLEKMLETNSMVALGRKYGMSDNGLKKYAQRIGIVFPIKKRAA